MVIFMLTNDLLFPPTMRMPGLLLVTIAAKSTWQENVVAGQIYPGKLTKQKVWVVFQRYK